MLVINSLLDREVHVVQKCVWYKNVSDTVNASRSSSKIDRDSMIEPDNVKQIMTHRYDTGGNELMKLNTQLQESPWRNKDQRATVTLPLELPPTTTNLSAFG